MHVHSLVNPYMFHVVQVCAYRDTCCGHIGLSFLLFIDLICGICRRLCGCVSVWVSHLYTYIYNYYLRMYDGYIYILYMLYIHSMCGCVCVCAFVLSVLSVLPVPSVPSVGSVLSVSVSGWLAGWLAGRLCGGLALSVSVSVCCAQGLGLGADPLARSVELAQLSLSLRFASLLRGRVHRSWTRAQAPPSPSEWWKELWGLLRKGSFPPVRKGRRRLFGEEPPALTFNARPGLIGALSKAKSLVPRQKLPPC